MMQLLSSKQEQFIAESTAKWNLAHGSVRTGKTIGSLVAFMTAVYFCPDSKIWMMGHTSGTIYHNAIRLLLEANSPDDPLIIFKPFLSWHAGSRQLKFRDKTIFTVGAGDNGAMAMIQGKTMSLVYCDEITLYPESIINMIDTRLSLPHSRGYATMNPSHPGHIVKQWIDKAMEGDKNYYQLHFTLDDNPFVDENYKQRIRDSSSGLFYKRHYLGLWCLAEGAIFDFFDRKINVVKRPPRAAEYYIAAIDYGTRNPFAALIIGVNTGRFTQTAPIMWAEKEYYWNPAKTERQKVNSEFAEDMIDFFADFCPKYIYLDPSAESFQLELRKRGLPALHANNEVEEGIRVTTSLMKMGNLFICEECDNLIREIESYVWDSKKSKEGVDEPLKKDDHAIDALRYAVNTHKIPTYLNNTSFSNPQSNLKPFTTYIGQNF